MRKGFTLIELLIVLIIIGVLATLAIPQYTNYVEKARAAEALSMISAMKTAEATRHLDTGVYTNDIADLDAPSNIFTTDDSAVEAHQYWSYEIPDAETSTYRLRATRSAYRPGGQGGTTIDFVWSDTTGASWEGTHPGRPRM